MVNWKIVGMTVLAMLTTAGAAHAFSDEYEPYYPHITAVTRSDDEIYRRITAEGMELPEETVKARYEMIRMYKNVGIDVSYDCESVVSTKLIKNVPQRYSEETPSPLDGDYANVFSIDACWNNKIPEDAPRVLIPDAALQRRFQVSSVSSDFGGDGDGVGIPQVVGTSENDYQSVIVLGGIGSEIYEYFKLRLPEGVTHRINNKQTGDEHAIFIDGDNKTGVEIWQASAVGDPNGYSIARHLLPSADIRGRFGSVMYSLTGIGGEGRTGCNAASLPMNAFTIKPSEIQNDDEMIEHALGAAIRDMCGARVFPAYTPDSWSRKGKDDRPTDYNGFLVGTVPYGGVMQLDPELDIDAIFEKGKISRPTYKILKAMQEYGVYNIDCSGGSFLIYTSCHGKDFTRAGDTSFNVPFKDGAQGYSSVSAEVRAFMNGDPFFEMEKPKLYVTVPVVKYADLDVNDDGAIDQADYDAVKNAEHSEYNETTKAFDVNQDKIINGNDTEIMYRYFNDLPMHEFTYYDAVLLDNDTEHGTIVGSGYGRTVDGVKQYRKDALVQFCAYPDNGWEFDGWTGDFAEYTDPVVQVKMDREYVFGAKYKKTADCKVTIKTVGGGSVQVCTDKDTTYREPEAKYGINTLLAINPIPEEGWQFDGWQGDLAGFTSPGDILITKDTEITAVFVKNTFKDPIKKDEWEVIKGGKKEDVCTISEGSKVSFVYGDFSIPEVLLVSRNENIDLSGDYVFRTNLSATANIKNVAEVVFNVQDAKNYYYFSIRGDGSEMIFGKFYNGMKTVIAKYNGKILKDGVNFNAFPMTIEVERKGGNFSIHAYKDGKKLTYFKDIRDTTHKGGTIGVGAVYNGVLSASNMVIKTNNE